MAERNRYYRILEKAKLEGDLFGQPERVAEEPSFPSIETLPPSQAESSRTEEPMAELASAVEAPAVERSAPEPQRSVWRQELASALGYDSFDDLSTLVVCPVGRLRSAAEAAIALAQWTADRSPEPLLIVDAAFESPQLARLFRSRRLGLSEALASPEPRWDNFVHEAPQSKLKILPAGRNPSIRRLVKERAAFQRALRELSTLYEGVIVIAPSPRVSGFEAILTGMERTIVFPVIEPGRTTASQAGRAARKLAAASARVAASLTAPDGTAVEELRRNAMERQLGAAGGLRA